MRNKLRLLLCVVVMMVCMPGTAFASNFTTMLVPVDSDANPCIVSADFSAPFGAYVLVGNLEYPSYMFYYLISEAPFKCTTQMGSWSDGTYNSSAVSGKDGKLYYYYGFGGYAVDKCVSGFEPFEQVLMLGGSGNFISAFLNSDAFTELNNGKVSGGSQEAVYDSTIPAPQNFRYILKQGNYGGVLWDSFLADREYGYILTGDFYYDCWVPNIGTLDDGRGYLLDRQIIKISDHANASDLKYDISTDFREGIVDQVKEKLNAFQSSLGCAIQPTRFDLQFYYVDDDGVVHYGDYSKLIISWSSNMKFTQTSSVYKGEVDQDSQTGSAAPGSGTHITDDNVTHGGGGVSLDGYNHFDEEGNVTSTDSSSTTIEGFLTTLANLPSLINRFFQSISSFLSAIGVLPDLLSHLFMFLPPEFGTILTLGISCVIFLRIFGR